MKSIVPSLFDSKEDQNLLGLYDHYCILRVASWLNFIENTCQLAAMTSAPAAAAIEVVNVTKSFTPWLKSDEDNLCVALFGQASILFLLPSASVIKDGATETSLRQPQL